MRVKVTAVSIVIIFIMLASMMQPVLALFIEPGAGRAGEGLTRVVLVKLWEVRHETYMAKFVGEDYIVVFDSHGDVSLDGRYISAYRHAYIYDIRTGKLLGTLTGPGTWEVISWNPFHAIKVWGRSGFFSADGSRMIEDVEVYGATASVVDTTAATWTTIPIEWGPYSSSTRSGKFYAAQLDYSGSTLVVGHIASGTMLVFKYDPASNTYKLVFEHKEYGNYGRRLQMTLDGRYILIGGLYYKYLDIWEWNGSGYSLVTSYELPGGGGVGALGISDPWNVGYVIVGTYNGWVIIGRFDPATEQFKVIYKAQHAGQGSWFYNPFYERWIPKVTEVFALASKAGIGVVYDVLTNQTIEVRYGGSYGYWKAAAVSPEGNYVFLGNALYMVVKRDIQARHPRVRFWGTMVFERQYQDLSSTIVFKPPARDWHLYFYSGRLTIKRIYVEPVPVELVNDPDILNGRLQDMLKKGLWELSIPYTKNAEINDIGFVPEDVLAGIVYGFGGSSPNNYLAVTFNAKFKPPPYFSEGEAWVGVGIHVPLNASLNIYDEMVLHAALQIHSSTLLYNKNKRALAILGVPVKIGGGIGVGASAFSKIANKVLQWYATKYGVKLPSIIATAQSAAKLAGIVGIAIAIWGGVDAALVKWGGLGDVNIQSWIAILPTVVDKYGNKYTAMYLMLPRSESSKALRYYDILARYLKTWGYKDVGLEVRYLGDTWDDYTRLVKAGLVPEVKLDELIMSTIASKYGLSRDDLKITGVDIVIMTAIRTKETFWEWVAGGVSFASVTLVGAAQISVKARLKPGTITDPSQIASLVGRVKINNKEYKLTPGADGAYVDFAFNLGTSKLIIEFGGKHGYYADIDIKVKVLVKKDFEPLGDFGYTARLHYNWNDTMIRIERIEFADMPYPMYKAERIFIYKYGNFTNDITSAFELSNVIDDSSSPSGKYYYYITRKNTKFIDPANGGIMMPCKTYVFNYFYREPPDVGIQVYLNGTKVTSTLAHHATVVLKSTAEQDVWYVLTIAVKYLEGLEEKTLMEEHRIEMMHVFTNTTAYKTYDITSFVDAAIEFMRSQNKTAYVEIKAKIVEAKYDYRKDNDEAKVVYYPPPLLPPPLPPGKYNVTVRVYEYNTTSSQWIPSVGTTVEVYYGSNINVSAIHYIAVTNEQGEANFTLESGTWTFVASKPGYITAKLTTPIYNDTVIQLYLSPVPQPPPENRTYVRENVTVTFNVYDATNSTPVPGATIQLVYIAPRNSSHYGSVYTVLTGSNGLATIIVPIGYYNVTVTAANYETFSGQYLLDKDMIVNIPLVPARAAANIAKYARLEVIVIYKDRKPYTGAHVEIRNVSNGALIAALATNSYGNATILLPRGYYYNVTVHVEEPLYNRSYHESRILLLENDTVIIFELPWNSTQPPITINATRYYWLTVQVVWANGLPFHGARVTVYNYTSGKTIDSLVTNGTGTVHFLLPAFKLYVVTVNASNPYNTSETYVGTYLINLTDNRWITVTLPWTPEAPMLAKRYRVVVFAYDVRNGTGVPGVTVIMRKGDLAWVNVTNKYGLTELWVPFLGLYNITGIHPDYEAIWRTVLVYENNTLIGLPLSPVVINFTMTPPPPLNGTYPPVYINGTPYYWLSIQVLWNDGYPFHGANVTVIDLETGNTIAAGVTNGTGFVHFLIPANKTIKYIVKAANPYNTSEVYTVERTLVMNHHYYFVHVLPWPSKYFAPEVWLKDVKFIVHRGQGYLYGNVSHLVVLDIWTNKPQKVTVLIGLYNISGDVWIANKTVTLSLAEGLNTFFEWISVNASMGGYFRVFANITQWEYDTDPSNNWAWSNTVFLKPMVDIQVFVLWRPVKQKMPYAILPGDLIEIDIGARIPINTTKIPARLIWKIEKYDLINKTFKLDMGSEEEIRIVKPGIVWRNVTVKVPWTSKIMIVVNMTHPWEDFAFNNAENLTIPIDPDVMIKIKGAPRMATEGSFFKITVNITSNVEPGKGIGWITVVDNTTGTLLKQVEVKLAPQKMIELEIKAPENPTEFWIVRRPSETHLVTIAYTGYDTYPANNRQEFKVVIISYQWLTVIAIIIVLLAIIAAFKALTHTIHSMRSGAKRFVRRRLLGLLWNNIRREDESKRRFVRKKE